VKGIEMILGTFSLRSNLPAVPSIIYLIREMPDKTIVSEGLPFEYFYGESSDPSEVIHSVKTFFRKIAMEEPILLATLTVSQVAIGETQAEASEKAGKDTQILIQARDCQGRQFLQFHELAEEGTKRVLKPFSVDALKKYSGKWTDSAHVKTSDVFSNYGWGEYTVARLLKNVETK